MKRLIGLAGLLSAIGTAHAYDVVATNPSDDYHGEREGLGFSGTLVPPESRGAALLCSDCHAVHGTNIYSLTAATNGQSDIVVTDGNSVKQLCAACHAGNAAVWHETCVNQCHADPAPEDRHPGFGVDRIPNEDSDCLTCHGHGVEFVHTSTCLNCHGEVELRMLGVPGPFPPWSYHTF